MDLTARVGNDKTLIYAAFIFWMLLIILGGVGVYALWVRLLRPSWVNWALLPGTIVSGMGYILGCLITGGEVRRAKIIPLRGKSEDARECEPTAEAAAKFKRIGPVLAALLAIVACGAAMLTAHALLGEPVIRTFCVGRDGLLPAAGLPKSLPADWGGLWALVHGQVSILKRTCDTWGVVDWGNWRVPLFVYLSMCLAVRLCPVRRNVRSTLAAVVLIAAVIAMIGLIWGRFGGLIEDLWPLVTYVWASLLFMLVLTLLLGGTAKLIRVILGKNTA